MAFAATQSSRSISERRAERRTAHTVSNDLGQSCYLVANHVGKKRNIKCWLFLPAFAVISLGRQPPHPLRPRTASKSPNDTRQADTPSRAVRSNGGIRSEISVFIRSERRCNPRVAGILFLKTVSPAIGCQRYGLLVKHDHGPPGAASSQAMLWTVYDALVASKGRLGP